MLQPPLPLTVLAAEKVNVSVVPWIGRPLTFNVANAQEVFARVLLGVVAEGNGMGVGGGMTVGGGMGVGMGVDGGMGVGMGVSVGEGTEVKVGAIGWTGPRLPGQPPPVTDTGCGRIVWADAP